MSKRSSGLGRTPAFLACAALGIGLTAGCGPSGPETYVPDKVPVTPKEGDAEYDQYMDDDMSRYGPSELPDGEPIPGRDD